MVPRYACLTHFRSWTLKIFHILLQKPQMWTLYIYSIYIAEPDNLADTKKKRWSDFDPDPLYQRNRYAYYRLWYYDFWETLRQKILLNSELDCFENSVLIQCINTNYFGRITNDIFQKRIFYPNTKSVARGSRLQPEKIQPDSYKLNM